MKLSLLSILLGAGMSVPQVYGLARPKDFAAAARKFPRNYPLGVILMLLATGWSRDASGTPYVKRVIGIAGDTVAIHDGKVFVNGTRLDEPYIFGGQETLVPNGGGKTWTLGPGQLFVMGDHRQASQDSRDFGPINRSAVIGRVWIRYWPIDQFGMLPRTAPSSSPGAPGPAPTHP